MSAEAITKLCSEWDGSSGSFAQIVEAAVRTLGLYQRELANEFQVADSTVSRWANGIARPHPRLQKMILASIERRAKKTAKAQLKYASATALSYAGKPR